MTPHSITHIKERLTFIQGILEATYDNDDGNILSNRLTEIGAYMAEAGKLKGDAEFHYREKLRSQLLKDIKELIPEYASANLQNTFVKSCANEEATLVTYADRVNASCTHQIDSMRSQLSFLKSLPR